MIIKLVDCTMDHLEDIHLADDDGRTELVEDLKVSPDSDFWDYAYALEADREVIACMGYWEHWPGCGRAWSFLSPSARNYKVSLHKSALSLIAEVRAKAEIFRVEATVKDGFDVAARWVEVLGFEREGLMKSYTGRGEDYILYARTF